MNRKIDMAVALILLLTLLFLAVLAATGNLPVALTAVYAAGVAARWAYLKWFGKIGRKRGERKRRLNQARALVAKWAFRPDYEAAYQYLAGEYDMPRAKLILLPRHESDSALGVNGLLETWRSAGGEHTVIATTGAVGEGTAAVAEELKNPRVTLIDGEGLARAIARSKLSIPKVEPRKKRRLLRLQINRKNAPRIALCALSTLLLYLVTGKIIYLLSASTLLFFAGLGLAHKNP